MRQQFPGLTGSLARQPHQHIFQIDIASHTPSSYLSGKPGESGTEYEVDRCPMLCSRGLLEAPAQQAQTLRHLIDLYVVAEEAAVVIQGAD